MKLTSQGIQFIHALINVPGLEETVLVAKHQIKISKTLESTTTTGNTQVEVGKNYHGVQHETA